MGLRKGSSAQCFVSITQWLHLDLVIAVVGIRARLLSVFYITHNTGCSRCAERRSETWIGRRSLQISDYVKLFRHTGSNIKTVSGWESRQRLIVHVIILLHLTLSDFSGKFSHPAEHEEAFFLLIFLCKLSCVCFGTRGYTVKSLLIL